MDKTPFKQKQSRLSWESIPCFADVTAPLTSKILVVPSHHLCADDFAKLEYSFSPFQICRQVPDMILLFHQLTRQELGTWVTNNYQTLRKTNDKTGQHSRKIPSQSMQAQQAFNCSSPQITADCVVIFYVKKNTHLSCPLQNYLMGLWK